MDGDEETSLLCDDRSWMLYYKDEFGWVRLSAFTVAELGEMLEANWCNSFKANPKAAQNQEGLSWGCMRTDERDMVFGATEADARAKMLIYLLENKLISI
jgi:hypothetical protein